MPPETATPSAPASNPTPAGGTPTPAAPASPAGSEPSGGGDGGSFEKFDATFADLDDVGASAGGATPQGGKPAGGAPGSGAAPAKPAGTPAAGARPAPAKPAGTRPAGAAPAQPETEEVDGIPVPKFKKDGEFRNWGLAGYKRAKQLEGEVEQLRAKSAELEQKYPRTEQERNALAERIKDIEKRLAEREEELKYVNYERSGEYQDKYEQPYREAVSQAYSDVKELTVAEIDPTQPPDANGVRPKRERPATPEDFDEVYQLPLGAATKLAAEKFGTHAAPTVLQHRQTVRSLSKRAVKALEEWKGKAAEREKQERERTTIESSRIQTQWKDINEKLATDPRGQEWWGQNKDDKEVNDAVIKGLAFVDRRFSEDFQKMSPMEQLILDASIRMRVAGFYKMRTLYSRLKAENEQLKKDLSEYRDSSPGGGEVGDGGGEAPATESEGAMAEFDKRL